MYGLIESDTKIEAEDIGNKNRVTKYLLHQSNKIFVVEVIVII